MASAARHRTPDLSELESFPPGWKVPDFEVDRPGREYVAGTLYLVVSCNAEADEKPWHCSIFYGGDVDAAWTKDGFATAAAARTACVNAALRMLRETKDAVQRADKR